MVRPDYSAQKHGCSVAVPTNYPSRLKKTSISVVLYTRRSTRPAKFPRNCSAEQTISIRRRGEATVHYTVIGCIQEILGNVASVHIFTVVFMETMQEILLRHLLATRCLPWLFLGPKNWAVCHTPLPPGTSSFLCE